MAAKREGGEYPAWTSSVRPAPGDLRIVQAFVNTCDLEKRTDDLRTVGDLAAWLCEWGLIEPGSPIAESELRQALELREGFRELLANNNGYARNSERLKALERALGDLPLRCLPEARHGLRLAAVGSGWPQAAARMLMIALLAIGDGSWKRLKACRRDDCQWIFFDFSKNRSGRWCAMAGCGDLMKARAYRRRKQS